VASHQRSDAMSLLIIYFVTLMLGESIAAGFGLVVEHFTSPHAGLSVFIPLYFLVFWLAWKFSVRITAPRV
jgi:hypothetical protein